MTSGSMGGGGGGNIKLGPGDQISVRLNAEYLFTLRIGCNEPVARRVDGADMMQSESGNVCASH